MDGVGDSVKLSRTFIGFVSRHFWFKYQAFFINRSDRAHFLTFSPPQCFLPFLLRNVSKPYYCMNIVFILSFSVIKIRRISLVGNKLPLFDTEASDFFEGKKHPIWLPSITPGDDLSRETILSYCKKLASRVLGRVRRITWKWRAFLQEYVELYGNESMKDSGHL